jgi:hypothetical protein
MGFGFRLSRGTLHHQVGSLIYVRRSAKALLLRHMKSMPRSPLVSKFKVAHYRFPWNFAQSLTWFALKKIDLNGGRGQSD